MQHAFAHKPLKHNVILLLYSPSLLPKVQQVLQQFNKLHLQTHVSSIFQKCEQTSEGSFYGDSDKQISDTVQQTRTRHCPRNKKVRVGPDS